VPTLSDNNADGTTKPQDEQSLLPESKDQRADLARSSTMPQMLGKIPAITSSPSAPEIPTLRDVQSADTSVTEGDTTLSAPPQQKHFAKTLRLTSDQLKALNLKKGPNNVSFTVQSSFSGVAVITARIFLWESDYQVVISDIDGTITK
jgi:phosphatidate phosphatase LPIN